MLGPKRKAALCKEMERVYEAVWGPPIGLRYKSRAGIAAVVEHMLAREDALVRPVFDELARGRVKFGVCAGGCAALLDAYAASQADPPEPRYKARDCGGWWVVEDTHKPMSDGVLPVVGSFVGIAATRENAEVLVAALTRERAREGGGK